MLKLTFLSFFLIYLLFPLQTEAYSQKGFDPHDKAQVRSTLMLKKYMRQFGTLVAGIEIMKAKEKNPDWEVISMTIGQLEKTLQELRAADKAQRYAEFTGQLDKNLQEVKGYGLKKDKRVFESFDKLTETCFKCHAVHRPSDFLIPKKKDPRISEPSS